MEIVYKAILKQNERKSNKQNKYKTHWYAHTHIKENDTETYEQISNIIHIKNYTNTYNIFYPDCQKQNIWQYCFCRSLRKEVLSYTAGRNVK